MKLLNDLFFLLLFILFSNPETAAQVQADSLAGSAADSTVSVAKGADETLSQAASQAYRSHDYKKSIVLYESMVAEGLSQERESAQIYYNLGNAYFRDHQLGRAILNYERALLLNPGDGDIRHNLRFAYNRTEDRIEPAGNLLFTRWFDAVKNRYSSNSWATIAVVLFILFLLSVAVFLFVRFMWARKTAFYSGMVLLLLVVLSQLFAYAQKEDRLERRSAIVMTAAAPVNASPDENSNMLFELHEGTRVSIRSKDDHWYEIEIANGSVGWTEAENVEII